MNFSRLLEVFSRTFEFVRERPWLNGLVKFVMLTACAFALYRFLMSERGAALRNRLPFLKRWYGFRQIRYLIQAGEFAQAGDQLLQIGQIDQAIEVFQQGNLFGRAADVFVRKRQLDKAAMNYERAGEFTKAAEIYLQRKEFDRVESSYKRMGKEDELGRLYESKGEKAFAATAYLNAGQLKDAARVFRELGRPKEAGEALLKAYQKAETEAESSNNPSVKADIERLGLQSAKALEDGKEFARAGELYLQLGKDADAARCFEALGDHKRAASLFEQTGNLDKAAEAWAQAGDTLAATRMEAERLVQAGEGAKAIAKFQQAGDFSRAAELYKEVNDLEKAALMYEKAKEFALAGLLWKELQRFEDAGRTFERAKDFQEAIDCYGQAKMPAKQVALMEKMGDFLGVAEILFQQNLLEESFAALAKVPEDSPDFRAALSLKGRILLERGDPVRAKEFFEQSLKMAKRLSGKDLETVYNLAVADDESNSDSNALHLLEKMLAQDSVEKDAVEKANNIRKLLADRAYTKLSRIAAFQSGAKAFAASESALARGTTAPTRVRYIKIKEIGRGGMGIVYTAKDTTLDRVVALKILPSSLKTNEQAVKTFLREAKAAGGLNHPNIVTVHDAGTQEGEYYIAMEYIEGRTIKEIIKSSGRLSIESVKEVLRQLLSALAYAHSMNVVHRDLTTNNIMWTKQKTIKIMDFGLAKIVRELMSEQSIVGGTPSFMSPEQTLGKPIDHRTDLYSLGICVYEMLLGELPFTKGDLGFHHVHTPPPIPKDRDPSLPDGFNVMILRCMEKEPPNRFQSVEELQELLAKIP